MTTAAPPSVAWVRLAVDGSEFTLTPSPDIELRLTVNRNEYDGYLDPLTIGPPPGLTLAVDLIPLRPREDDSVFRCEAMVCEVAGQLGLGGRVLHEFALEVALGGEGLPYNRMEVPRLLLASDDPPALDEDGPESFVRVFTAKVPSDAAVAYTVRQVD